MNWEQARCRRLACNDSQMLATKTDSEDGYVQSLSSRRKHPIESRHKPKPTSANFPFLGATVQYPA